ncbi:MAG: 1,4-dihydroxy-2-naphthoate polyprenyltransferase [Bacteroidales bacterium]|nr:1,4-dihydroxy-2-naphthoate polyprenyltransferase [Bacteroidales bacterium]
MNKIKIWIEAARLRTLPVSIAGVIAAIGVAKWEHRFSLLPALICLVFAVLAQVTSNFANEYYDFKRGADKKGRVGPRRGVTEGDINPETLKRATFGTLALACAVGCCLIPFGGWWLVPVGIAIAVFALAYSAGPFPLSYNGLGDVAVLVFFGLVPVNFTYYVQAGGWSPFAMLVSVAIGLMGVNVLLVNNYRDMDDDKEVKKRTTVVIFGRKIAGTFYLISGYFAAFFLSPIWFLLPGWTVVIPLLYLVMHTATWHKLIHREGSALNPLLGATGRNMLIFAVLLAVAMIMNPR